MQTTVYVYASERQKDEVSMMPLVHYHYSLSWPEPIGSSYTTHRGASRASIDELGESLDSHYHEFPPRNSGELVIIQNGPDQQAIEAATQIANLAVRELTVDELLEFVSAGKHRRIPEDQWVVNQ